MPTPTCVIDETAPQLDPRNPWNLHVPVAATIIRSRQLKWGGRGDDDDDDDEDDEEEDDDEEEEDLPPRAEAELWSGVPGGV